MADKETPAPVTTGPANTPADSPHISSITRGMIGKIMAAEEKKTADAAAAEEEDDTDTDTESDEGGAGKDVSGEADEETPDGEGDDDSDSEDDGETDEEEVDEKDSDDDSEEEEADDEDEDSSKFKPKKPIQATIAGKKTTLPADTKIMVPIDGKMVEMDLHKALSEVSGRFKVDQELGRANRIKSEAQKTFELNQKAGNELKKVEDMVTEVFTEAMSDNEDPFIGYHMLAEMIGVNALDFERRMMVKMSRFLIKNQEYFTDVEKERTFQALRKGTYLEHKEKRETELRAKAQKREPLEQAISDLKKQNGLTDSEWNEAESVLRTAKKDGKIQKLEPRQTVEMALYMRASSRAETLISEAAPDLRKVAGDESFQEVQSVVVKAMMAYSPSDDELEEIIRDAVSELLGDDEDQQDAKRLRKKVDSKRLPKTAKPKKETPVRTFAEARKMINAGRLG